ncbi:MAG: pseudaminic acid synthase [Bacteroidetes bacterium]|nr:pseudaminic acid synthase [bacterium]NBP65309.1 pseudaminic acid synthase [Bacteroidota bacterium]
MKIQIGKHTIGSGYPTFIIAEMSGNHGGSLDQAIKLIHAAKSSGADAIKLQTYTADTITLKSDKEDFCLKSDNAWAKHQTLWELYDKAYTPWEWHERLFAEAKKLRMEIFSSPFDETAVDFLEQFDPEVYKIASPEITHIPLLKRVARTGKPVIISTGISNLSDIELAVSVLRSEKVKDIIILQCSTAYPAPPEETNLAVIEDMKKRFNVLSGLSDHSMGVAIPIAAVALGANVIEKHITLDSGDETVDSFFSTGEKEFAYMVSGIRLVEKAIGKINYDISPTALKSINGRRSLYVSDRIKKGEIFTPSNIKCIRPAYGLHPQYYENIIGRKAKVDLEAGDRLSWDVAEE